MTGELGLGGKQQKWMLNVTKKYWKGKNLLKFFIIKESCELIHFFKLSLEKNVEARWTVFGKTYR